MFDTSHRVDQSSWERFKRNADITFQQYLDASVPHRSMRWALLGMLTLIFIVRIVFYQGFYLIAYWLGIQTIYLALPLVTPITDPETMGLDEMNSGSAHLPSSAADNEFRPFVPVEPEFVVWRNIIYSVIVSLFLTMFSFLDIPVYWPILFVYFLILLCSYAWTRVRHMLKHKYVPWNTGKPRFVPKNSK